MLRFLIVLIADWIDPNSHLSSRAWLVRLSRPGFIFSMRRALSDLQTTRWRGLSSPRYVGRLPLPSGNTTGRSSWALAGAAAPTLIRPPSSAPSRAAVRVRVLRMSPPP